MNGGTIQGKRIQERFHTLLPDPGNPLGSLMGQVHAVLHGSGGPQVLEIRAFASAEGFHLLEEALGELSGFGEWPISILDGTPAPEGGIAGIQLHLVEGATVETIRVEGEVVGRAFQDDGVRYCVLGGVGPPDPHGDPASQTTGTLLRMEEALRSQGMGLKNLVRTWFFLDHILDWYGEFNGARTALFRMRDIFQGYVPASTGIGGRNHRRSALVASGLAMLPLGPGVSVSELPSPLQCPAGGYGSSFSRAAELAGPGFRRVLVSGTASIDPEGRTAHRGRVEDQIALTVRVVEAILESRGMGWEDVVRGNAYFKDASHVRGLEPRLADHGLPRERFLVSRNTVCREDLLFELEADAVRPFEGS